MQHQRTLAIIKPDIVSQKKIAKIIDIIESNDVTIIGMKLLQLSFDKATQFYAVHTGKYFFDRLVKFISSGPIVVLALEAPDVINRWRTIMGNTDPALAAPGTIRNLFGSTVCINACHGSDSPETAEREIDFFFTTEELIRREGTLATTSP